MIAGRLKPTEQHRPRQNKTNTDLAGILHDTRDLIACQLRIVGSKESPVNIINKTDFAQAETLTKEQLFSLVCSESHRHEVIYQKRQPYEKVWTVYYCAKTIIEDWDCDFHKLGEQDDFFKLCAPMYDSWQWELVDPLQVCIDPQRQIHNLENGHHRSFVLSCLLLQNKVEFQDVPVLNTASLEFDRESDKAIEIALKPIEYLNQVFLGDLTPPIGAIPDTYRTKDRMLYDEKLNEATQLWMERKQSSPENILPSMNTKLRNTKFDMFQIEPDDRDTAIAAAFICDAILAKIQPTGSTFFMMFDAFLTIPPPYLLEV